MKLIKPSYQICKQSSGIQGVYEQIEMAGRTAYKSQAKYQYRDPNTNKIYPAKTDNVEELVYFVNGGTIGKFGSCRTYAEEFDRQYPVRLIKESATAKAFVDRMIKSSHGACLEHGTIYLILDMSSREQYFKYCTNPYSVAKSTGEAEKGTWKGYVTTNYRVIIENGWIDDMQYLCEPTEFHEKRITVRFICDRGVSHEFVRHRKFSFLMESTRYCNYSKDKFGGEITFIIPSWMKGAPEGQIEWDGKDAYVMKGDERFLYLKQLNDDVVGGYDTLLALSECEYRYMFLIQNRMLTPQQARAVLPNALKTELIMTGFVSDWKHFFDLRTSIIAATGQPHPDAAALADPLYKEFIEKGIIEEVK